MNSVISKYRDLSVSRTLVLLVIVKALYFAQLLPTIVNYSLGPFHVGGENDCNTVCMPTNMLVREDLKGRKPFLFIICINWTLSLESLYLLSYLASVKSTNGCNLCEVKLHPSISKNRIRPSDLAGSLAPCSI